MLLLPLPNHPVLFMSVALSIKNLALCRVGAPASVGVRHASSTAKAKGLAKRLALLDATAVDARVLGEGFVFCDEEAAYTGEIKVSHCQALGGYGLGLAYRGSCWDCDDAPRRSQDRKSTRLNSSHWE